MFISFCRWLINIPNIRIFPQGRQITSNLSNLNEASVKILWANHPRHLLAISMLAPRIRKSSTQRKSHGWNGFGELSNHLQVIKLSYINTNKNIWIFMYIFTVLHRYLFCVKADEQIYTDTHIHTQILGLEIKHIWGSVHLKATGAGNWTGGA